MTRSSRNQSPANRQERQERAQAAALYELEVEAEHRRRKSNELRKLRMESEREAAMQFKAWREQKKATAGK